ncbi:hypothetical protein H4CHR_04383 [Variovorax sp. PBS-H4]|uniref:hypothetical protein n=1 Tax=Variovorax sp. PBS-H4 TaxID=434008 RepID=UPI001315BA70|nr:hypothetical protein [Variovorax sp. PBS-H4]VTU38276.1 hypothetical protein H4CHR_04383 [Variovorax sp. PBS-H4]
MQIHAYRRTESALVSLFGLALAFAPNSAGHVVAQVDDERATERLLSIPEAYCEYTGDGVPAPAPVAIVAAPVAAPAPASPPGGSDDDEDKDKVFDEVLIGSDELPATFDVLGATYTQAQVVDLAFARSGMNREEWNLNDEDDREALIEGEVTKLILAAEEAKSKLEAAAAPAPAPAPAAAAAPAPAPVVEANPLLIANDKGETLDIGAMSATKVREFATANGIELPKGNSVKVGELRLLLAKALTGV